MKFTVYFKTIFGLLSIAAYCLLLVSCDRSTQDSEVVRIGLLAYTEDEHRESMGLPTVNAARMAVDSINSTGGVKLSSGQSRIELIVDGVVARSPQNAVSAFRKLTNRDKVSAVVGLQYSVDAIPAGSFAEKARVPFISPMSTHSRTTQGRDFVYRMSFVDQLQGSVMARFAYHTLASRRAAVLFDQTDPYSSGIADVFSATYLDLGGAVVSWQPLVSQQVDFVSIIDQIRESDPDVLYLPGFGVDVAKQVQVAKESGLEAVLLGADGWDMQAFAHNASFDNSYATSHWFTGAGFPGSLEFVDSYTDRYGHQPDAVAALTYDAMNLLFSALELAGSSEGKALQKALMGLEAFNGVSGPVNFVDSGNPDKGVLVLRLNNGQVSLEQVVTRGAF